MLEKNCTPSFKESLQRGDLDFQNDDGSGYEENFLTLPYTFKFSLHDVKSS